MLGQATNILHHSSFCCFLHVPGVGPPLFTEFLFFWSTQHRHVPPEHCRARGWERHRRHRIEAIRCQVQAGPVTA